MGSSPPSSSRWSDRSGGEFKWKQETRLGRELSLATLKQFRNAEKIRDAFFAAGGQVPSVLLTVTPEFLSPAASAAELEINGTKLEMMQGIETPKEFNWPGSLASGTASVSILPEIEGTESSLKTEGAWALYRLLSLGSISQKGDKMFRCDSSSAGATGVLPKSQGRIVGKPVPLACLAQF